MKKLILFKSINRLFKYKFLQHKIDSLREILKKSSLEIICVDETNDESFPDHQCKIDGYQFTSFRRDRDKYGGGKVVYVKIW